MNDGWGKLKPRAMRVELAMIQVTIYVITDLGLVGLLPPPTLPGLNPAINVAVSGFISIGL